MHVNVRRRFVEHVDKRRQLLALFLATRTTAPQYLLYRKMDLPALRYPKRYWPPSQKSRKDALLNFIAAPPATVLVPNVVGTQVANAIATLASSHLSATETFNQSLTVAVDVVISQAPAPGTTVPRGGAVALVVSLGASVVPNVVGEQLDQAVAAIIAAGLIPQTASQPTNSSPPGTVLGQLPSEGTAVLQGSVVSLIVAVASSGGGGGPVTTLPAAAPFAIQRGLLQDVWQYWGGDVTTGNTGDLATVSGTIRGQQRVLRRLLTNPGEYIWQPTYGAGLPLQIGQKADIGALTAIVNEALCLEDAVAKTPPPVVTITPLSSDRTGYTIKVQYVDATTNEDTVLSFSVGA